MTAEQIAAALTAKPITPLRIEKMRKLCERMKVNEADVLKALPAKDRKKVQSA